MRLVHIGAAAVSLKVGDFRGNIERLGAAVGAAKDAGVHLLVTPELSISGYSLEDRIWWPDIAKRSAKALERLAAECRGLSVFAGLPVVIDGLMYNAAALIHDGEIRGMVLKKFLPTYGIFYEGRNWTPWAGGTTTVLGAPAGDLVFKLPYGTVSAEVCEDLWSVKQPARERVLAGAEVICNLSASPFTPRKNEQRKRLVLHAAQRLACVYAYANILGLDNSRLVFDGGGFVATPEGVAAEGPLLSMAPFTLTSAIVDLDDMARFRSENTTWREYVAKGEDRAPIATVDSSHGGWTPAPVADYAAQLPRHFYIPDPAVQANEPDHSLDELFDALTLGLRDYFEKSGVFDKFLIALSGGRDSALCLLLAVEAAKALDGGANPGAYAQRIETVYLPNRAYSTEGTESAARALAEALGVPYRVVPIDEESSAAFKQVAAVMGGEAGVSALSKQNLQARIRGTFMLNWANNVKGLVLVTSNLSEAAVGYTTTGGDNQGGYSPIANVPKSLISILLGYIAKRDGLAAIEWVLAIPPSAELAHDQTDEEDLMPYAVLDDLLYLFARRRLSLPDVWRIAVHRHPAYGAEQLREWTAKFGKLFAYNQWKREQLPVALKVMDLDLDPKTGFRFPVTQSIEAELDELRDAAL